MEIFFSKMVQSTGFEPVTSSFAGMRSSSWTTTAYNQSPSVSISCTRDSLSGCAHTSFSCTFLILYSASRKSSCRLRSWTGVRGFRGPEAHVLYPHSDIEWRHYRDYFYSASWRCFFYFHIHDNILQLSVGWKEDIFYTMRILILIVFYLCVCISTML